MRMRRACAATGLALVAALGVAPAASAQEESPVVGVVVQDEDGAVMQSVQIDGLYPTASQDVVFLLDGEAPAEVRRMRFAVEGLEDFDNGCNRPEKNFADTTCEDGADQGELSEFLTLTLTAGRLTDDEECTPVPGTGTATTLAELASTPATVGLADDEGTLCVLATFAHAEREGDNVTQTDSTVFDLRLAYDTLPVTPGSGGEGDAGGGAGAGQAGGSAPPVTVEVMETGATLDLGLADTGAPTASLVTAAFGLLAAGGLLVFLTRRRIGVGA